MPVVQYQNAKTATSGAGAVTVTPDAPDDVTSQAANRATIATANVAELLVISASAAASKGKAPSTHTDR
jgi:hypothetical protein